MGTDGWAPARDMRDRAPYASRADVLAFDSPPLAADLEVTGPLAVTLFAASSAQDTDFIATLDDVFPDGYVHLVQQGIVRARYRNVGRDEPLEPGATVEYTIDLWSTSYVVRAGHKLRLEISSSEFDRYDRNLNVYEPWGTGCRPRTALRRCTWAATRPRASRCTVPPSPGSGYERPDTRAPPVGTRVSTGLDSWRSITALLWLGFVGLATFQLIPLLTDQLVDVYGFGDAKAGLISSWYCGAGFVASVIAFYWLPRWDRRTVLFVALVLGLAAEVSSLFVHAYAALAAGRVVTGFAAASITCLVLSAITRSRRAEHLYGLYTATISLCAAAGFIALSYALPAMRSPLGDGALFAFFSVVWALGLVAAAFVPRGTTSDASEEPETGGRSSAARRGRASRS